MSTGSFARSACAFFLRGGRAARNIAKLSPRFRTLVTGGAGVGTTSLALSFFSAKEEKPKSPFPNYDVVVKEVDGLYDNYLIDNAYNLLKKYESSTCSEMLWRLARVLCEKGKLSKNPEEKKKWILEGYAVVQKAVEHEPPEGCFGAHKWLAILLDYVGEIEGNKSRIAKSYDVRTHLEKALAINPNDATTWHILGVWHFSFADMSSLTRMVAKTIFGTPPTSTYEQALEQFLKAEQIQPNFYSTNTFYIAEVYDRLGQKEKAIEFYRKAFRMPVVTADDHNAHVKAHEKLKKAKISDSDLV